MWCHLLDTETSTDIATYWAQRYMSPQIATLHFPELSQPFKLFNSITIVLEQYT